MLYAFIAIVLALNGVPLWLNILIGIIVAGIVTITKLKFGSFESKSSLIP